MNYNGADTLGLGGWHGQPSEPGGASHLPQTRLAWFNKALLQRRLAPWNGGTGQGWGNAGKDKVILPGLFNWNMALFKNIPHLGEGPEFQLRFETFNTFNHTEFQNIDNGFNDGNFGQVTSCLRSSHSAARRKAQVLT